MYLSSLHLEEFRAYRLLDLDLDAQGIRLVGPNASGKTSLLEAVALLATTRSPRARNDREVVRWGSGRDLGFPPYTRVEGVVRSSEGETALDVTLEADSPLAWSASPFSAEEDDATLLGVVKKRCRVNDRPVRAMDLVGHLRSVLFGPEDVGLVSGPPAERRRHLDLTISQLDQRYMRALARFNRMLSQRNSLLRSFVKDAISPASGRVAAELGYWDDELAQTGAVIAAVRAAVISALAVRAAEQFAQLTGGGRLKLWYRTNTGLCPEPYSEPIQLDAVVASARELEPRLLRDFRAALDADRSEDLRRGVTTVGPHRDDLLFTVDGVDLGTYGSRGQHRLAILALRLAEVALMQSWTGEYPVVLLDDVLSELDPERGSLLIATVAEMHAQVLITATEPQLLDAPSLRDLPMYAAGGGTLRPLT
jgi:DNA replication and repair protein RecF